jgi:response regulator RpfG family c-di-GMP phosphodiesterase
MDEKNVQIFADNFESCRRTGESVKAFDCEFNKDDLVLFIEASVSLLKDSKDAPVGFRGIIRDRTEKKKLEMNLIESYKNLQEARIATILGLAKLAEYRDEGTGTHLERIREYAKMLTQEMANIPELANYITREYIDDIFQSSILHDIGKVGIPDAILLKPGRLTAEEFEVIKRHATLGGDAIRAIESRIKESSFLLMGKEIAYHHHEKWDGSGYPTGLKGDEIPLSARIVALADVYDALTTKRFYKEAYSHEKSKQIILNLKDSHFDPQVVEAFVKLENAFNRVRKEKLEDEMTLIEAPAQAMHS